MHKGDPRKRRMSTAHTISRYESERVRAEATEGKRSPGRSGASLAVYAPPPADLSASAKEAEEKEAEEKEAEEKARHDCQIEISEANSWSAATRCERRAAAQRERRAAARRKAQEAARRASAPPSASLLEHASENQDLPLGASAAPTAATVPQAVVLEAMKCDGAERLETYQKEKPEVPQRIQARMSCGRGGRNIAPVQKTDFLQEAIERDYRGVQNNRFEKELLLALRRSAEAAAHSPPSQLGDMEYWGAA